MTISGSLIFSFLERQSSSRSVSQNSHDHCQGLSVGVCLCVCYGHTDNIIAGINQLAYLRKINGRYCSSYYILHLLRTVLLWFKLSGPTSNSWERVVDGYRLIAETANPFGLPSLPCMHAATSFSPIHFHPCCLSLCMPGSLFTLFLVFESCDNWLSSWDHSLIFSDCLECLGSLETKSRWTRISVSPFAWNSLVWIKTYGYGNCIPHKTLLW